jgi:hypothetical protein
MAKDHMVGVRLLAIFYLLAALFFIGLSGVASIVFWAVPIVPFLSLIFFVVSFSILIANKRILFLKESGRQMHLKYVGIFTFFIACIGLILWFIEEIFLPLTATVLGHVFYTAGYAMGAFAEQGIFSKKTIVVPPPSPPIVIAPSEYGVPVGALLILFFLVMGLVSMRYLSRSSVKDRFKE